MTLHRTTARALAAALTLCVAGAAHATITFVTTASGNAFTGGSKDTFGDLAINTDLGTLSLPRSVGTFSYVLGSTAGDPVYSSLFTVPVAGTDAVSTGWYADALTFNLSGSTVLAFGGNFFATNVLGELASGGLTLIVTDTLGGSKTQTIGGNSLTAFAGFISDVPLQSLTVSITSPNTSVFASADNVVLSAVPEPAGWLMLLAGGTAALRIGRRRG
jgi:hypothetical protein